MVVAVVAFVGWKVNGDCAPVSSNFCVNSVLVPNQIHFYLVDSEKKNKTKSGVKRTTILRHFAMVLDAFWSAYGSGVLLKFYANDLSLMPANYW